MPGWISAGIALVGAGVSAYGQAQAGAAGSAAAKYQAAVARNNAALGVQKAGMAQQQSMQQAADTVALGSARIGAQRAALGASGVALDSGSALGIQQGTAIATQRQVQQQLYEGTLKAYSYLTQSSDQNAQAGLDEAQASNAQAAGAIGAFSSIASGASTVADKWYRMQSPAATTSGASPGYGSVGPGYAVE